MPSNFPGSADTFTTAAAVSGIALGADGSDGLNHAEEHGLIGEAIVAVQNYLIANPAGGATVRKFPITFNSSNILTGHTLYTPAIGDVLLDAWIQIDTAWDGTTPLGDIGTFVGSNGGMFTGAGHLGNPVDMTLADVENFGTGIKSASGLPGGATTGPPLLTLAQTFAGSTTLTAFITRVVPAIFTATNPVKFCVSQNGLNNGADPVPSQGSGVVYLITATPV